jgi:uncharacterized membrane protein YdjX (TVP38/TMEM64 family)
MQEFNRHSLIEFLGLAVGLLLVMLLGKYLHIDFPAISQRLRTLPFFVSAAVFIALYVGITFFVWFSKDFFRITSAILFGAALSTALVWAAEVINGCILFSLARTLGRDFVEQRMRLRHERLDRTLSQANFFWLFVLRAVPLVPFRFYDLGCGLTGVSFGKYIAAVTIGSLPRIFWLQYILAGVGAGIMKDPQALVKYLSENPGGFIFTFVYFIFGCALAWQLKKKGER